MRIPVTLLTGYLGAGKTTVINHLLSLQGAPRFTVLVNDFGALDIDARLIADRGGDTITLSNGCACCSIGEDLGEALGAQLARPSRPQRLIIEASGVAEPARIAKSIVAWSDLHLEATVTVADAGTVEARLADKFVGTLVRRQLQAADLLLLNKADLCDASARDAMLMRLRAHAPAALRLAITQGAVEPSLLFGRCSPAASPYGTATELSPFHTLTLDVAAALDLDTLALLFRNAPPALHRVKGFVRDRQGRVHLVQAVAGARAQIEPYAPPGSAPGLGLVCIAAEQAALDAFAAQFHAVTGSLA